MNCSYKYILFYNFKIFTGTIVLSVYVKRMHITYTVTIIIYRWYWTCQKTDVFLTPSAIFYDKHKNYHRGGTEYTYIYTDSLPTCSCFIDVSGFINITYINIIMTV